MRKLSGLLALALASLPAAAGAQLSGFLGPDRWWDPAPATYQLVAAGTNLCVTREPGSWIGEAAHLKLRNCASDPSGVFAGRADQFLELAPAAVDVPPAPRISNTRWRVNNRNECATIARGVVFGAPRVDMHPCDLMPSVGGDTNFRGGLDQSFFVRRLSASNIELRTPDARCWTVQGGNLRDGTHLMVEPCNNTTAQVFTLRYSMAVMDIPNMGSAERFGWFDFEPRSAAGVPDRFRSLPGLDLPGNDIASMATDNDQGKKCARACADNNACRAFTWVEPNRQGPSAMCWLKSFTPEPVRTVGVRSGIVRPQ
jgi:hypothetical protein